MVARRLTRRKKAYDIVKHIFSAEKAIRLAVIEAKTADKKGDMCGGSGGVSYKSDPTAGKSIRQLTKVPFVRVDDWLIRRPEDWLMVISLTYANTRDLEREIMRKYYSGYKIAEIATGDCGYAESTLYAILDSFQQLAVEIACQFGLIRVVDVENNNSLQ